MKVLSIGNSFSIDAHAYLYALAKQRNIDLELVDLAIGGCSLQKHWENVVNNRLDYLHVVNGEDFKEKGASIEEILKSDSFDVITLQQVSHLSGQYETYQPYLNDLIAYVHKHQPNAKLYLHRTWAYEIDSTHSEFYRYDCNQQKMYEAIKEASLVACKETGLIPIPAGNVIQALRQNIPKFDYANGGESLCIDGFHMSHTYGRYAVALTWLATLTGRAVEQMAFMDLDPQIIASICEIVNKIVFE